VTQPPAVAIVGGGYAGMAAAVRLAGRGVPVTVFEAAAQLGGRARGVPHAGTMLDNGLHILIGAYARTLALISEVAGDAPQALMRLPLVWSIEPALSFRERRLPAPLGLAAGLLLARGPGLGARLACLRFLAQARLSGFRLAHDCTVRELLARHRQHAAIVRYLWEPLCVAALNTPADSASAQVFLNVLRDGLAGARSASDLLLPRVDLTALFPAPAARYAAALGARILTRTRVLGIARDASGFVVRTQNEAHRFGGVIVATAPHHVPALVNGLPGVGPALAAIERFSYQPITSIYLKYATLPALPLPMIGAGDGLAQWIFDRRLLTGTDGLVAAVISARGRHEALTHAELAARTSAEVGNRLGFDAQPEWWRVFEEKRATFACVPGIERPESRTAIPGLFLAGDYTASPYPATLEAAVRSGEHCAELAHAFAAAS